MAGLNITEAAKLVGLSRQHLHRAYIKTGQLSVSRDRDERPYIDPSELVRVFGDRVKTGDTGLLTETELGLHTVTVHETRESVTETAVLKAKVTALQQACEDLRHDKRRLETQVDRLQNLLEHKPAGELTEVDSAAKVAELATKLEEQGAILEAERVKAQVMQAALVAERSRGFFSRVFGGKR